jgi:NhaA family Na+:H+ antiporter
VQPTDRNEIRAPWSRSDRAIARRVVRPLQEFLRSSTAGAIPLFIALVIALVWANAPWWRSYETVWTTPVTLGVGRWAIVEDVRFWVNEGLMTLFFLLAGLEIKRELTTGELRDHRAAIAPVIGAICGMALPVLIYLAITRGSAAVDGWGMAMPTDLAFALGILALARRALPAGLRPFLLTLAIVDDLLTVVLVGVFYASGLSGLPLLMGLAGLVAMYGLERLHVRSLVPYVAVGALVWVCAYAGGVHPALVGALLGILAPATPFQRPAAVSEEARRIADETSDEPATPDADAASWLELSRLSSEAVSPLTRIEHALLPWTNLCVLPAFALANAGVHLTSAAWSGRAALLVIVGLVASRLFGKVAGIVGGWSLSRRLGVVRAEERVGRSTMIGAGLAAGAPFTVSLFVASSTFADDPELLAAARLGVLLALVLCAVAAVLVLRRAEASS